MKHVLQLFLLLISLNTFAQTSRKTLNYQAVILDPKGIDIPGANITGQPLYKGNVCLRFSLLNAQGGLDYEETQQVTTDEFGLVSVAIGTGSQAQSSTSMSIYKIFESIVWNANVKSLKVSVSYDGCSSFKQVSSQIFNYIPYALYAEAVDYKNVREAPTKLSQFTNDAGYLVPKDLDPIKSDIKNNTSQIAVANQAITDNKQATDAAFLVVNQSITSLDKQVAQNTGSISTINTKITDQQNQISDNRNQIVATNNTMNAQIGGLQGQINNTNNTVSNLTGVAEIQSNKSTATNLGGANPSDIAYPSQRATKAYVDNAIYDAVGSGVPDATTLAAGKVKLSGDLGGTAMNPTVPGLANKENSINKSTAINLGAGNPSDILFPTQKATKTYVDNAIFDAVGTGVPDATTIAAGKVRLAGDLAGTASNPTVPGLLFKEDVANKSNASLGSSTTLYPTQNAVKSYVDVQIAAATIADADGSTKGKLQLTGDLGGTAASPTVPGLTLKEDVSRKSTATDLGAGSTSDINYPSQKAVKIYVDAQVATATVADASANTKGKLQLSGDLTGTAASPLIATGAINSSKIQDRSIATDDIADAAITDEKVFSISGVKVTGNIAGNSSNVTGLIAVGNGGTGATSLTGYVKGNGTAAMSTVSAIPVADVTGAVKKVNGTLPNSSGDVTILFGRVTTGNYANVPTSGGVNGDIYIVSGDGNASQNGRTFIKDDNSWNEVSPNTAATDARYLQLAGGIMEGNLSVPTGKKVFLTDAPTGSTDAVNKAYVDAKISSDVPNATSSVPGKIQLIGDIGGTATAPTVPGLVLKAPINNPAFTGTVTGITKAMVGLGNVENTSDANKPISTAAQVAFDSKAPIASPTFTGTVTGITKAMVNLANVDNTSDANKPVSTASQTALDLKENAANKSNLALGTSTILYPTQNAVKTYVDAQVALVAPDADAFVNGKVRLAGDFTGTASSPAIATGAITSAKILDGSIATADLANSSVTDAKISSVAGTKLTGNISGNAANVTGTVPIANGGTGATTKTAAFDALSPMTTAGDIIYGSTSGTALRLPKGTDSQVLTLVSGLPAWTTNSVTLPQDSNEESLSTIAQTSFTLTRTPVATSRVKMYINGIRIGNTAYTINGRTVTYIAANNGAYDLGLNDRIQFDYQY